MALLLQQEEMELGSSMYDMVRRRRSKDVESREQERKINEIKKQLADLSVSILKGQCIIEKIVTNRNYSKGLFFFTWI